MEEEVEGERPPVEEAGDNAPELRVRARELGRQSGETDLAVRERRAVREEEL